MAGPPPSERPCPQPLTARPAPPRPPPAYARRPQDPPPPSSGTLLARLGALGIAVSPTALAGCAADVPELAPIFEHGSGIAAFGCKAVAPPAYLSEEQALEVLREELEAAGLFLDESEGCSEYSALMLSIQDGWAGIELLPESATDRLDACTAAGGLGVEVVTQSDYYALTVQLPDFWSLHAEYYLPLARYVAANIQRSGQGSWVGVFYEPAGWQYGLEEPPFEEWSGPLQASRLQLRRQARDFVEWIYGEWED